MTIDTACSSSLSAVHLACQSLRLKESKMVSLRSNPGIFQPNTRVIFLRIFSRL
jgi:phthiocerol/phenolphthiocerol synthesis type-I polyketide synthase B